MNDEAIQQFEALQRQMQNAERRLGTLEGSLMDIQQTLETLAVMRDGGAEDTVLIPIGAGVQVRAKLETQQVLRAIGSETAVGGSIPDTITAMEARREQVRKAFEETAAKLNEWSQRASQIQQQLSSQ